MDLSKSIFYFCLDLRIPYNTVHIFSIYLPNVPVKDVILAAKDNLSKAYPVSVTPMLRHAASQRRILFRQWFGIITKPVGGVGPWFRSKAKPCMTKRHTRIVVLSL